MPKINVYRKDDIGAIIKVAKETYILPSNTGGNLRFDSSKMAYGRLVKGQWIPVVTAEDFIKRELRRNGESVGTISETWELELEQE